MFNKRKENEERKEPEQPEEKSEEIKEEGKEPKTVEILYSDFLKLKDAAEAERKEKEEWKNKAYMAYADTANLRKSLEADHREALRYRAEGFVENLLPALDSFYMALSAEPNSQEAKNYQQGFSFIYNQLQNALSNEGVTEILPKVGDDFDPAFMHAMEVEESEDEGNKVLQVYSKGYRLHEKLIKPVMVKVSKQKQDKPAEETKEAASAEDTKEANKA